MIPEVCKFQTFDTKESILHYSLRPEFSDRNFALTIFKHCKAEIEPEYILGQQNIEGNNALHLAMQSNADQAIIRLDYILFDRFMMLGTVGAFTLLYVFTRPTTIVRYHCLII